MDGRALAPVWANKAGFLVFRKMVDVLWDAGMGGGHLGEEGLVRGDLIGILHKLTSINSFQFTVSSKPVTST